MAPIKDVAGSALLADLCASIEPVIDEVIADDYLEIVEAARRRIAPATTDGD